MPIQVLIIEDEARAANQLQKMLKASSFSHQLIDVIDTVEDAVLWFQNHSSPELVFMDIQLADGLSFEIFEKVNVEAPIIFTTAFDHYAIQAFKVNSVDYLLKPIQEEDLEQALNKFAKSKESKGITPEILKQLGVSLNVATKRAGILVKEGSAFLQLKVEDLLYLYSEESITFGVNTSGKRYIIDETLDQVNATLDTNDFFRINRGQIVARSSIDKIHSYFNNRVKLTICNPRNQEFIVSRQKTRNFKNWVNS